MADQINSFSGKFTVAAFTVVTPNYLAHAFSLRKSFLQHNPETDFFICVTGGAGHCPEMNNMQVCFLDELADACITAMTKRYNPFELSCALKPFFALHILEKYQTIKRLIYLDGDMLVFGPFTEISDASIILSPHRTKNVNYLPGLDNYSVTSLNRYGVYNAGYFELRRKEETFNFLKWWKKLMETFGANRPGDHFFTDQLWLNLVPTFFDDVFINKNPGYNVALWNLIERKIFKKGDNYFVNGEPLMLFHFSKYRPESPDEMVDYTEPYLTFEQHPDLKPLYNDYRQSLLNEGYEKLKLLPYPFSYKKINKKKSFWQRSFN